MWLAQSSLQTRLTADAHRHESPQTLTDTTYRRHSPTQDLSLPVHIYGRSHNMTNARRRRTQALVARKPASRDLLMQRVADAIDKHCLLQSLFDSAREDNIEERRTSLDDNENLLHSAIAAEVTWLQGSSGPDASVLPITDEQATALVECHKTITQMLIDGETVAHPSDLDYDLDAIRSAFATDQRATTTTQWAPSVYTPLEDTHVQGTVFTPFVCQS